MKKLLSLLFAGALMIVLGVACDKDDPTPRWTPRSPLELDDELFHYLKDGRMRHYTYRKDRVAIKADSYGRAQALSGQLIPSLYMGEWVFAQIDSLEMDLSDVLELPGVLDATYGLESENGGMQYTMNEIIIQVKEDFSLRGTLNKVGLLEHMTSLGVVGSTSESVTFNLSAGETLRICRKLYETGQCVFAEPNFIIEANLNNTYFPSQWGLKNTGQSGGTSGIDIKAEQAWAILREVPTSK